MKRYKIVRCPNCTTFQITSSDKTLKCVKCSKTKVLSKLRILYSDDNPQFATKVLQEIKLQKPKQNEKYSEEFKSVI